MERRSASRPGPFHSFEHNYNQVSREVMYNWFNKYLALGEPGIIAEQAFEPVPPKQLSVYDDDHPRPSDSLDAPRLRKVMTQASEKQIAALLPKNANDLREYRRVVGTALRGMIADSLPSADAIEELPMSELEMREGYRWRQFSWEGRGRSARARARNIAGRIRWDRGRVDPSRRQTKACSLEVS